MAMRKISKFVLSMVLMLSALWALSPAMAEDLRLGVISSGNTRAVADVLSVELSKNDSIHLLERDDIDKLVGEAKITDMLKKEEYAKLGSLIGAEALILLSDGGEKDKGAAARLVAVTSGVVVSWRALPADSDDLGIAATLVKDVFLPSLDKIRRMNAGQVIPVSLLGLRFELEAPGSVSLERKINTLLAQNLSRSSGVVVLERWDLLKLAWEKNLMSDTSSSFWTGRTLIDGRITRDKNMLEARVRLRTGSAGRETWLSARGTQEDVPTFVESVAALILAELGSETGKGSWNQALEADNYALLGQWAQSNELCPDAVSAFETALALGYDGRNGKLHLVQSYLSLIQLGSRGAIDKDKVPATVDTATQALDLLYAVQTLPEKGGSKEPKEMKPVRLNAQTIRDMLRIVVRVLRAAHETGYYKAFPRETQYLRRMFCACAGEASTKYETEPEWVFFASYWTETPEETLEIIRKTLRSEDRAVAEHFRHYCSMRNTSKYKGLPKLVAWKPSDEPRLPGLWQKFVSELLASDEPQSRADGLMFKYVDQKSLNDRHVMLPEIYAFFKKHEDSLAGSKRRPIIEGLYGAIEDSFVDPISKEIRTLRFEFVQHMIKEWGDLHGVDSFLTLQTGLGKLDLWSADEAKVLYLLINERMTKLDPEKDNHSQLLAIDLTQLKSTIEPLLPKSPESLLSKAPGNTLTARKFITFRDASGIGPYPEIRNVQVFAEGRIWQTAFAENKIHIMNPATGGSQVLAGPETPKSDPSYGAGMAALNVTDKYVFLVQQYNVWKYTRKSGAWAKLKLPPMCYCSRVINDRLYLSYNLDNGIQHVRQGRGVGNGLLCYDPADDSVRTLISTRRTPSQSTLDQADISTPRDIFPGLQNRVTLMTEGFLYECLDEGKTWRQIPPQTRFQTYTFAESDPEGVLIYERDSLAKMYYLALSADEPELLLKGSRNATPGAQEKERAKYNTRWILPKALRHKENQKVQAAVMSEGTLWVATKSDPPYKMTDNDTPDFMLHVFRKGKAEGQSVPIRFEIPGTYDSSDSDRLTRRTHLVSPDISKMAVLPEGLVILARNLGEGFWYIPFSDIPSDGKD